MKYTRKIVCLITLFLLISALLCCAYLADYYHAEPIALESLRSDGDITIIKEGNMTVFSPSNSEAGFIFYPGGKVEAVAYAPLLRELANRNILCVLLEMPANLAVLDSDAAQGIPDQFPEISEWYIGGHSLGGSMAASYLHDSSDKYAGLILLAAYSTADLSDTSAKVLSIYGSADGVLNIEKYNQYLVNLPDNFQEYIIPGGNHAQFGKYGSQEGDGLAAISSDEQIQTCVASLYEFIVS